MRFGGALIAILCLCSSIAWAETTAFIHVNVIPMDTPRVLADQTVVVTDGVIAEIGPNDAISIPEGAQIIDGASGYLMPGLADMHMHLDITRDYNDPEQLLFFLAQGSTSVRVLGSPEQALVWRDQVAANELVGPTIYLLGPTLAGNYNDSNGIKLFILGLNVARVVVPLLVGLTILWLFKAARTRRSFLLASGFGLLVGIGLVATETPPLNALNPLLFGMSQVHALEDRTGPINPILDRYAQQGFDGVKLYDGLTEKQFLTAVAGSAKLGLYTVGHMLNQIPLDGQLSSGLREVAHVHEFLSHHWTGYNYGENPDPRYAETRKYPVDLSTIPQTVDLVAKNGVSVLSNLSTDEALFRMILDLDSMLADPEFAEFRPDVIEGWKTSGRHLRAFADQGEYRRDEIQPFLVQLIKAPHDAGVPILIGSDAGEDSPEGSIPRDIHREIELLVEAGLSNFDALSAGTKTAGEIVAQMGRGGNFGTIEIGQRADFLLLSDNPLENVSATRQRIGVMSNGKWFKQADLDAMVKSYLLSREW